jgi:hypothetical protein
MAERQLDALMRRTSPTWLIPTLSSQSEELTNVHTQNPWGQLGGRISAIKERTSAGLLDSCQDLQTSWPPETAEKGIDI